MQNAPNIQYTPTETKKNVGPPLSKVLISLSSIREDAKQKPIRRKRQLQETFTKSFLLSLAFQSVNDRKSISTLKCIFFCFLKYVVTGQNLISERILGNSQCQSQRTNFYNLKFIIMESNWHELYGLKVSNFLLF